MRQMHSAFGASLRFLSIQISEYPVTPHDPVAPTDLQTTDGIDWPGLFTVGYVLGTRVGKLL
jgi:hypothetical protein